MRTIETNPISASADFKQRLDALISRAQQRSGMSYETFVRSVTENAFRSIIVWSEYDMERLLVACEVLQLSPVTREVFAIKGLEQKSSVQIVIGLGGWLKLMEQHPAFEGMDFDESEELEGGVPSWIKCTIYRRDRRVAMSAKEYLVEARRGEGAWLTHPRRMLRNKALVQCARLAFSLPSVVSGLSHEELTLNSTFANESFTSSTPEPYGDSITNSSSSHTDNTEKQTVVCPGNKAYKKATRGPSSTQQLLRVLAITPTVC